jgi:hypothetical protein
MIVAEFDVCVSVTEKATYNEVGQFSDEAQVVTRGCEPYTVKTRYNVIKYNKILSTVEILLCHTYFPLQMTEIIVQHNGTDFELNSVISKN